MQEILFDYIDNHMSLSDEEKKLICDLSILKTYKKGTILLEEGKRSQENYFVLKGCLRTYYVIDGEEKTTEFYTELEALAPHCVLDGTPSAYYVSCVEDVVLMTSTPKIEQEAFLKFPRFEMLCRVLSEKLVVQTQSQFYSFKTSTPEQRYLLLLQNRPDLFQRVPQHQLASYLGITPQSLSRLRSRLVKK